MKRRLFTLTVALSATLFLLTSGMWIRSYWIEDEIEWQSDDHRIVARSLLGRVEFFECNYPSGMGRGFDGISDTVDSNTTAHFGHLDPISVSC